MDDMASSEGTSAFRLIYEREVPFEMRVQHGADPSASRAQDEVGTLEALRTKMMLLGNEDSPAAVRLELTSENDLFFHYTHTMDAATFADVQDAQKLVVRFGEYCAVLIRMLNMCIREPHANIAVFVMQRGGRARIDFIQNMEYKYVELLSCACLASDDETIREELAFRYNALKSRLAAETANYRELEALVKQKSPHLLLLLREQGGRARAQRPPESRSKWLDRSKPSY